MDFFGQDERGGPADHVVSTPLGIVYSKLSECVSVMQMSQFARTSNRRSGKGRQGLPWHSSRTLRLRRPYYFNTLGSWIDLLYLAPVEHRAIPSIFHIHLAQNSKSHTFEISHNFLRGLSAYANYTSGHFAGRLGRR
jgi:hypothetical protein